MKSKLMLTKPQRIALLCVLPFLAAAALVLASRLYAAYIMDHVPPCILRSFTGLLCPGCGMTHAVFALAHGDIMESLRENALLLFGAVILLLRYLELWLGALGRGRNLFPRSKGFWCGVFIFWSGYYIIRNLI